MNSPSAELVALIGYVLAVLAAVVAYRAGFGAGARQAHRLWEEWTGLSPAELQSRRFDEELRRLRRDIGRPADPWPEQTRED